jgi:hypothetical protein
MRKRRTVLWACLIISVLGLLSRRCEQGDRAVESGGDTPIDAAPESESGETSEPPRKRRHTAPPEHRERDADSASAPSTTTPEHLELSPLGTELTLEAQDVHGRVVDEHGEPRAGVEVHLVSTWLRFTQRDALLRHDATSRHRVSSAISAPDGSFTLTYVRGGERVLVAGNLHAPVAMEDITRSSAPNFVVPRDPISLCVSVKDHTGAAVVGANLTLIYDIPWQPAVFSSTAFIPPTATTDAAGIARFEGIAPGTAEVTVATRGVAVTEHMIAIDPGAENTEEIRLAPPHLIRLRVTDAVTRRPIARAEVQDDGFTLSGTASSDADGKLSLQLRAAPTGTVFIEIAATGYSPQAFAVPLPIDGEREFAARLSPRATLILRCVDQAGEPIPRVEVFAVTSGTIEPDRTSISGDLPRTDVSDAEGRVEITLRASCDDAWLSFVRNGQSVLDRWVTSPAAGKQADLGDIELPAPR